MDTKRCNRTTVNLIDKCNPFSTPQALGGFLVPDCCCIFYSSSLVMLIPGTTSTIFLLSASQRCGDRCTPLPRFRTRQNRYVNLMLSRIARIIPHLAPSSRTKKKFLWSQFLLVPISSGFFFSGIHNRAVCTTLRTFCPARCAAKSTSTEPAVLAEDTADPREENYRNLRGRDTWRNDRDHSNR